MTICCQCKRHYWPGKGVCPSSPLGVMGRDGGCMHQACDNCERYIDEKEKSYEQPKEHKRKR
jgi:hypothetical protein